MSDSNPSILCRFIIKIFQKMISSRFVLSWTRIQFSHDLSVSLFKKVIAFDLDIPISGRNCACSLAIKLLIILHTSLVTYVCHEELEC